jgi:hypothetical protein
VSAPTARLHRDSGALRGSRALGRRGRRCHRAVDRPRRREDPSAGWDGDMTRGGVGPFPVGVSLVESTIPEDS